jgi:hypothetical protein
VDWRRPEQTRYPVAPFRVTGNRNIDMKARSLIIVLSLLANLAWAEARQVSEYEWQGVDRIVAIGDIHGD